MNKWKWISTLHCTVQARVPGTVRAYLYEAVGNWYRYREPLIPYPF
jgi:hypothetical protein